MSEALIHRTDLGNAKRLVNRYGDAFRWNDTRNRWMVWDGRRWTDDTHGEIVQAAKVTTAQMHLAALEIADSAERQAEAKWAMASESANRLEAMVKLARSEPGMTVTDDELDSDPWILNVANGVVDLRTGELHAHDPARLVTRLAPVDYVPAARSELWERFLERILPDPDVREFVARATGYSITGSVAEEVLLVAYGIGQNGKSKFLEAVKHAVGDYAMQAEPDLLLARKDAHPAGVAMLAGKRMVMATETDNGRQFAEATVKRLTGGDTITARQLYGNFFEFVPTHTIWMATNYRPEVLGTDEGIWRRLRIVPFEVQIPEDERDPHLGDKLAEEAPAILAWAVAGCRRWQASGLAAPAAVTMATASYRAEMDTFGDFLDERCEVSDFADDSAANLFASYSAWANENGAEVLSQKRFGAELRRRGFDKVKDDATRRIRWIGVQAKDGALHGL